MISLFSFSALACWEGYTSDTVKVNTPIYAQPADNASPFVRGNLPARSQVCIESKARGYAKIQYYDDASRTAPKFGYIRISSLSSNTEAASDPVCRDCFEQQADQSINEVEGSSEDIRRATERVRNVFNTDLGEALPYADRLQQNLSYALEVDKGFCARAVARALRAADLLPGAVGSKKQPGGFNGEDGYEFLSQHGFKDDRSACNRPGVVLIYGDSEVTCSRTRTTNCGKTRMVKNKQGKLVHEPGYLKGDEVGHAEILGTDGFYYYYHRDSDRLDRILGDQRRPLKYCMVSQPGLRGERL